MRIEHTIEQLELALEEAETAKVEAIASPPTYRTFDASLSLVKECHKQKDWLSAPF